jgi:Family of unknown function (DUF6054)
VAHYEQVIAGDVDRFTTYLDQAIPGGSATAKLEDRGDFTLGEARMVVRVYERYSALGGNRVSLTVSILAVGGQMAVSAITAGGSQAMFFKLNTLGEESFLTKAVQAITAFS